MHSIACYVGAFIAATMVAQVSSIVTIIRLYGETIEVPCNSSNANPPDLIFTKWKYGKDDGTHGDLLIKSAVKDEATIQASDSYKDRVRIADNSSLLISQGTMGDQRVFTCMIVSNANLNEYPVKVQVYKKPSPPQIKDQVKELENGKLTRLGKCVARDASPAAKILWSRNGQPLVADGMTVVITPDVTVDPATGLSTTTSTLQYAAGKGDTDARFTCAAQHSLGPDQVSPPVTFAVHYPTESLSLQVIAKTPIQEGDNVTLKCQADGNPPPTSFTFHIKSQRVMVRDSDTYTLTSVTRNSTGEYKCSLADNDSMEATGNVVVSYLDLSLRPLGKMVKNYGDSLEVVLEKNASGDARVSWTKDNRKLDKLPTFDFLTYSHAGLYVCEVSTGGLRRNLSFHLTVEGMPVIKKLSKQRSEDGKHKVVICEAEGSPRPNVLWSVNGTDETSTYDNGKATNKITVVPTANLTVTCSVSNRLGEDSKAIQLYPLFETEKKNPNEAQTDEGANQANLIVGIVIGLIVTAAAIGLIYWLYMKKSRQGSWKTGEKEAGTCEESKKLEEANHKAEV